MRYSALLSDGESTLLTHVGGIQFVGHADNYLLPTTMIARQPHPLDVPSSFSVSKYQKTHSKAIQPGLSKSCCCNRLVDSSAKHRVRNRYLYRYVQLKTPCLRSMTTIGLQSLGSTQQDTSYLELQCDTCILNSPWTWRNAVSNSVSYVPTKRVAVRYLASLSEGAPLRGSNDSSAVACIIQTQKTSRPCLTQGKGWGITVVLSEC